MKGYILFDFIVQNRFVFLHKRNLGFDAYFFVSLVAWHNAFLRCKLIIQWRSFMYLFISVIGSLQKSMNAMPLALKL